MGTFLYELEDRRWNHGNSTVNLFLTVTDKISKLTRLYIFLQIEYMFTMRLHKARIKKLYLEVYLSVVHN